MTSMKDYNLTESEKLGMEELGKRISGDINKEMYDEVNLLYRFLRARNFNVDDAEIMFKKWLKWRKDNRMDMFLTEYKPPAILAKYFANMKIGEDKEGNCVFYFNPGKSDIKGVHMSAKNSDIDKTNLLEIEAAEQYVEKQSKKLKKRITGYVSILDQADLTFSSATNKKGLQTFIRICYVLQDYYPERLKTAYVINASSYSTLMWNVIKNFLAPRLQEKFKVFGTEGWQEELLQVIDADQLPAFLGGNRTDPDGNPLCKTIVYQGGLIDESYYIHKNKNSLADSPDVQKLQLTRASFSEIPIPIKISNSIIEWEFEIKNRDIGFGLFYKEVNGGEEKITELVSLRRLDTEDFSETGLLKCEKTGEYVVLFDNSYSWLRSKEILYRIKVVIPDDQDKCMNNHS